MLKQIDINRIADAVAKKLRAPVPVEHALWSTSDIGDYLGVSTKTVKSRTVTKPGFPLPVDQDARCKRYRAIEVIRYTESRTEKVSSQ